VKFCIIDGVQRRAFKIINGIDKVDKSLFFENDSGGIEEDIRVNYSNKNLAIANRSRVSCAHNTLRASIGINITPWP